MSLELKEQELDALLNDADFVFADYYIFRSVLGRGAFGVVVEAVNKSTLETMAVKVRKWCGHCEANSTLDH